MKTISQISEAVILTARVCPLPAAVSHLDRQAMAGAERTCAPAADLPAADLPSPVVAGLGNRSHKQSRMARINATGWPLGPQDRSSA